MDYTNITFILIFGAIFLYSMIKTLKGMYLIQSKKPYLGAKIYEFYHIGDYYWMTLIPFAFLIMTNRGKYTNLTFNFYDVDKLMNLGLFIITFFAAFYSSFQRRSIWTGGILDPTHGVLLWEDIISYSLMKADPPEINIPSPRCSNKYLLNFYYLKTSKLVGNEIKEIFWKIKEPLADKISAFLQEKISQKENAPIDDNKDMLS